MSASSWMMVPLRMAPSRLVMVSADAEAARRRMAHAAEVIARFIDSPKREAPAAGIYIGHFFRCFY